MAKTYILVAAVAYLLGSIPFGYILVKLFLRQDIRQTGSGNIGATNVARSGNKGLAIATLLLDAGKGTLAVSVSTIMVSTFREHTDVLMFAALAFCCRGEHAQMSSQSCLRPGCDEACGVAVESFSRAVIFSIRSQ